MHMMGMTSSTEPRASGCVGKGPTIPADKSPLLCGAGSLFRAPHTCWLRPLRGRSSS